MKIDLKTIILIVLVCAFVGYPYVTVENISGKISSENTVEMYSLSYCGKCKYIKRQLNAAGIPYNEILLDEWTPEEQGELFTKVSSNTTKNSGGVPFFKVNGTWIAHMGIEISDIKEELIYK